MTDFEKGIPEDDTMIEEWPEPYESDDEDDYDEEPEGPKDYIISFTMKGISKDDIGWISRHFFEVMASAMNIPQDKFDELNIEED